MPLEIEVEAGAGHSLVQLPDGYPINAGQTRRLSAAHYEQIPDSVFSEGILVDNGPVTPLTLRGTEYNVAEVTPPE